MLRFICRRWTLYRDVERGVVVEDPVFEVKELRPGFDAELLDETAPRLLVSP